MSRGPACIVLISILLHGFGLVVCAQEAGEQQRLIAVLQSDRPAQDKDAACARLKRIGSAESVPALAGLLPDPQLSHCARYALESMPSPAAEQALIEALDRTQGLTKVGIIGSLGVRADGHAVPALAPLLADPDAQIACAAAAAMGKIGGPDSLKALQAAMETATDPVHGSVADALLCCANRAVISGDSAAALTVFSRLYEGEKGDTLRQAAYLGMIRASGGRGIGLAVSAIAAKDGPAQAAALQCVPDIPGTEATQALAALLTKADPIVRTALIEGLAQRGDPAAAPAVAAMANSHDPAVQRSAVRALGILGDAQQVRLLAEVAASSRDDVQKAARQSLVQLRGDGVTQDLLRLLWEDRSPGIAAESARALGDRSDAGAVPLLLAGLAADVPDAVRVAGCRALAAIAGKDDVDAMVRLAADAGSDVLRDAAGQALAAVCRRVQSRREALDAGPIRTAWDKGPAAVRLALLPACSTVIDPLVRDILVQACADPDPAIRTAAVRAACATRDTKLLPHLLKVAASDPDTGLRVLAIRAGVRLTGQQDPAALSSQDRLDVLRALLACSVRPEDRRLVLSGLAEVHDRQALALIIPQLNDPEVRGEAAMATTKVASAIAGRDAPAAKSAMKQVLAISTDPGARQIADTLLKQIDANAGYITAWQVAGPYRQTGKDYAALFDIAMPPEGPQARDEQWRPLPAGSDPSRPWVLDLLKALGGEQCAAYARTWVHFDREQAAWLEMGSDDGLKVWLNGTLVHANNTARPLTPGSDRVDVTFRQGWNGLLLKVTQNNLPWEFCVRIVGRDGAPLEDLRADASMARDPGDR